MKKVLITTPTYGKFSDQPAQLFEAAGFEITRMPEATHEQILENIVDKDAILVGLEQVSEDVLLAGKKLKAVAKHGVGIDNIDAQKAAELGIAVLNAPGANSDAVADAAIGLMLDAARSISYGAEVLKEGKWPKLVGKSLWGSTLGIVGLGAIGKGVALRAKGFNMKIMAYDIYWDEEFAQKNGIIKASLDQIYENADFITLHVALTEETRGMIGREQLQKMKRSAIIVNTARGDLIDENALFEAVRDGVIAAAGIDVYSQEPPGASPLLTLDNIVATPHLATYTREALTNMSTIATKRIIQVFEVENLNDN